MGSDEELRAIGNATKFNEELTAADNAIKEGYLNLVVESYTPLLERVRKKATEHMNAEGIDAINMCVYDGLVLKNDGNFYDKTDRKLEFTDLPGIYQRNSDNIAAQADSRSHTTPSVHSAMRDAVAKIRDHVKRSLADVL